MFVTIWCSLVRVSATLWHHTSMLPSIGIPAVIDMLNFLQASTAKTSASCFAYIFFCPMLFGGLHSSVFCKFTVSMNTIHVCFCIYVLLGPSMLIYLSKLHSILWWKLLNHLLHVIFLFSSYCLRASWWTVGSTYHQCQSNWPPHFPGTQSFAASYSLHSI